MLPCLLKAVIAVILQVLVGTGEIFMVLGHMFGMVGQGLMKVVPYRCPGGAGACYECPGGPSLGCLPGAASSWCPGGFLGLLAGGLDWRL